MSDGEITLRRMIEQATLDSLHRASLANAMKFKNSTFCQETFFIFKLMSLIVTLTFVILARYKNKKYMYIFLYIATKYNSKPVFNYVI